MHNCDWIWENRPELKSILLFNIIATFKHCPDTCSDTIAIEKKVCFYRHLFANPIKPCRTITDTVGPLGALIRWHVVPGCSTRHLSSWYGQGCCGHLSAHCGHNLIGCVYTDIVSPPTLPTPYM